MPLPSPSTDLRNVVVRGAKLCHNLQEMWCKKTSREWQECYIPICPIQDRYLINTENHKALNDATMINTNTGINRGSTTLQSICQVCTTSKHITRVTGITWPSSVGRRLVEDCQKPRKCLRRLSQTSFHLAKCT